MLWTCTYSCYTDDAIESPVADTPTGDQAVYNTLVERRGPLIDENKKAAGTSASGYDDYDGLDESTPSDLELTLHITSETQLFPAGLNKVLGTNVKTIPIDRAVYLMYDR